MIIILHTKFNNLVMSRPSCSRRVTKTIQKEIKQRVLNIDPEQENLYKEAFDMIDTKQLGYIDKHQIRRAFKKFGQEFTLEEVENMTKALDQDNNGCIHFEEFITLMETAIVTENIEVVEEDEIIRAFRKFDTDNDGLITNIEFMNILTTFGDNQLTEEDAQRVFNLADLNHDGVLNFVEFVDFWNTIINK